MEGLFYEPSRSTNKKKVFAGTIAVLAVVGVLSVFLINYESATGKSVSEYLIEQKEFDEYLAKYGKSYEDLNEYRSRFTNFKTNSAYIRLENAKDKPWKLAVNKFSDMVHIEFTNTYCGVNINPSSKQQEKPTSQLFSSAVDWRKLNSVVTPVKDQGQYKAQWTFAAIGAIESAWKIYKYQSLSLSEQQLIDCSPVDVELIENAFDYAKTAGLTTDQKYPYLGKKGQCSYTDQETPAAKISGYKYVTSNNMNALASAVSSQPVSAYVDASVWHFYSSGVIDSSFCDKKLNHAVLVVGFDLAQKFWIVKNSWGADWGESGYVRVAMENGEGVCGLQKQALYPVV
jgi:KDEL-tailed cysteine endopeptidase